MEKVKVGFLTHVLTYGGASMSLFLMIKSLIEYPIDIYIYYTGNSNPKMLDLVSGYCTNIRLVPIREIHNNQAGKTSIFGFLKKRDKGIKSFIQYIKEDNIDILHINSAVFPHICKQLKTKLPEIKIITHVRELIPNSSSFLDNYFINSIKNNSDYLIFISDQEALRFPLVERSAILPNPFDFNEIKDLMGGTLRKKLNLKENTLVVGMVASFQRDKGQLEFIKILNYIVKNNVLDLDYKFVIIGFPKAPILKWKTLVKKILFIKDYRLEVLNYISKNQLNEKILIVPYTLEAIPLLRDLDVIVRPSLSYDPWGRDIIESMALKKVVIANGSSEFYIKNNCTGFLCDIYNQEFVANLIKEVGEDSELRQKMGELAYETIFHKCNFENYGDKIYKIYQKLVSEKCC